GGPGKGPAGHPRARRVRGEVLPEPRLGEDRLPGQSVHVRPARRRPRAVHRPGVGRPLGPGSPAGGGAGREGRPGRPADQDSPGPSDRRTGRRAHDRGRRSGPGRPGRFRPGPGGPGARRGGAVKSPRDVIIRPIVSEKSYAGLESNRYTFLVSPDANKTEIKEAIQQIWNVRVTA